jgi:hypothetical protein
VTSGSSGLQAGWPTYISTLSRHSHLIAGNNRWENSKINSHKEIEVNANIARYIALPIVSAGILGGAALGLAGMASKPTTE